MLVAPRLPYVYSDVTNGLVGYWKFDEGSGTTTADNSGNGNNGVLIGSPSWTTGKSGYALTFNGANYVDCGNAASLHVQSYTLSAWIRPSAINDSEHRIISNGGFGNTNGAVDFVIAANGRLVVLNQAENGQDECWSQSGSLLAVGTWSFVAATYDAATKDVKLYLNGTEVSTTINTLRVPNPNPSYNLHIGTMGGPLTTYFRGSIDEVRVYNRALTSAEISQLIPIFPSVSSPTPSPFPTLSSAPSSTPFGTGYAQPQGLVGYWNLDQGSGTIAYDSSGYNNHGTINGASWTNGRMSGALNFDGLNDWVDCGNNEVLDPTQGATIEAWVNFKQLPSTANHIMAIAGRSGGGTDLDLQIETDNKFKFFIGTGAPNVAVSNTIAETNEWYHIVGTYQAKNNIKIYVNGVLEKTTSISITRNTNPNKFCIGQSAIWSGRFFTGTIDEVKIFNRALSAEEVGAEYMHVSVLPPYRVMDVDQSAVFTAIVSGGTSPYKYQWYLGGTPVSGATSSSWTFTPSSSGSYAVYVNATDNLEVRAKSDVATVSVNPKPSPSPTPTPSHAPTPTVTVAPSANSVATVSGNSATADQSATTGVSITVNGSSLQDSTQLNVTSTNYGKNQPEGTGAVQVDAAVFYAVDVISNGGALSSDVAGTVSISNPSFNSASVIEYWNGTLGRQLRPHSLHLTLCPALLELLAILAQTRVRLFPLQL